MKDLCVTIFLRERRILLKEIPSDLKVRERDQRVPRGGVGGQSTLTKLIR